MSNIILISHWTGGDVLPFIRFGKKLMEEGHNVTVFSHCVYEKKAKELNVPFVAIDSNAQYEKMNRDLHQLSDPIHHREDYLEFHHNYHGKERLLKEIQILEPYCKSKDTIILARHRSSISGLLLAEKWNLPYASIILAPNYFSHMEFHEELLGKELKDEINEARRELGLQPITRWIDWLYSPHYIFGMWPEWFATQDESWPKGARTIGFLETIAEETEEHLDQELAEFIKEQKRNHKKVVLITGGSSHMIDQRFYSVAVEACERANVASILVTRYSDYVPDNLTQQVLVVNYAPLKLLMTKVDIIIHHGGMGTISEAVEAGIPQIILPHLTDGPDNAQRLAEIGVAKKYPVSQWNPEKIADGILESCDDTMKKLCVEYKSIDAAERKKRIWKQYIGQIPKYEYHDTNELTNEIFLEETKQKPSMNPFNREQLLALLRRKRGNLDKENVVMERGES